MSTQIKNIIFDLGGVLINWNPMHVYKQIFESEEKARWFLDNICTLEWNEEHDGGRLIKDGEKILIEKFPEWEKEILTYYQRWDEMLIGSIDETVDILLHLHQSNKYNLLALTNWSAETFPVALERFGFLQVFENILVSGEEKLKKPDPKIYQLALDRYNCNSDETIFIDDNARNIAASAKMGIHSIHFLGAQNLKQELAKHGVKVEN